MAREHSLYDAKAHLSALVRQVREGQTIIITVHGEPAAELRPIQSPSADQTLEERIADLQAQGVVSPAVRSPREFGKILDAVKARRRPGALRRFLDDRG